MGIGKVNGASKAVWQGRAMKFMGERDRLQKQIERISAILGDLADGKMSEHVALQRIAYAILDTKSETA